MKDTTTEQVARRAGTTARELSRAWDRIMGIRADEGGDVAHSCQILLSCIEAAQEAVYDLERVTDRAREERET